MMVKMLLLVAAALPAAGSVVVPPAPRAQQAVKPDARAVIAAVRKAIAENYVVPGKRAAIDAALAKGLAAGRYAVTDPQEMARRVSDDLFAVANDKHLGLRFDPRASEELGKGTPGSDEIAEGAFFREQARRANHGVSELRTLDGNIRLMKYDGFMWTGPESAAALDNAMAFLRGGDAIVIDLRDNGGGSPDAVRHIASYFMPGGVKLVTFHMRSDPPTSTETEADVPGGRISGVPVYVLTSGRTASAAEEFASHVRLHKFATLVGDTTAGAGYRNEHMPIPGGFVLSVSVGRPELPDGTDWEAKGVAPGIAVPQEMALFRAEQAALTQLAAGKQGPERTELEWAAGMMGARIAPATPALPLAAYAGRYGPRVVAVEGAGLTYQRDGGPKSMLVPIAPDLFGLEFDPRTRVRFVSAGGTVTGFVLERADGSRTEQPKG
jgi:hypothetical protein